MTRKTTSQTSFTPGPYVLHREDQGVDYFLNVRTVPDDRYVGGIWYWPDTPEDIDRAYANATLFQFAPDLFRQMTALARACRTLAGNKPTQSLSLLLRETEQLAEQLQGGR